MATGASTRHQCMIYEGAPSRMLPALVSTIRAQLAANTRCMYMNSPAMVAGVRSGLYAAGTDVEREVARGALLLSADHSHLVDGRFDLDRMLDTLAGSLRAALSDGYAGLFATGDMTWELGPQQEFAKLLEYEWRLEQLFREHQGLAGICQYHRDVLPRDAVSDGLVSHGRVFINETLSRLNPHYIRARTPQERRPETRPALDDALAMLLAVDG